MDTARLPSEIRRRTIVDYSLTSGLFLEIFLLASMEFADGALSD